MINQAHLDGNMSDFPPFVAVDPAAWIWDPEELENIPDNTVAHWP